MHRASLHAQQAVQEWSAAKAAEGGSKGSTTPAQSQCAGMTPQSSPGPSKRAAAELGALPAAEWLQRLPRLCRLVSCGLTTVGRLSPGGRRQQQQAGASTLQRAERRVSDAIASGDCLSEERSSYPETTHPRGTPGPSRHGLLRLCRSYVEGLGCDRPLGHTARIKTSCIPALQPVPPAQAAWRWARDPPDQKELQITPGCPLSSFHP